MSECYDSPLTLNNFLYIQNVAYKNTYQFLKCLKKLAFGCKSRSFDLDICVLGAL